MESVGRNDWKPFKSYPLPTRFFDWWLNLYNTNSVIKLFYTCTVTKDGKAIGEMEMAASKALGCIMHRMILSKPLDRDSMKQKAIDIVKKEYPGWELRSIKLVCYSYPMEGVMLTLVKPETKEEKTVIIDTYTSMEVPLKEPKNEGDFGAWRLYRQ